MFKRMIIGLMAMAFIFSTVAAGLAGDTGGDKRKGKYLYRKVYTSCFDRGGTSSKKPTINPDSKTQAQWQAVFEAKNFEEFGCKQEWSQLTAEELQDIFAYLHSGAFDSPTPAKCK